MTAKHTIRQSEYCRMVVRKVLLVFPHMKEYHGSIIFVRDEQQFSIEIKSFVSPIYESLDRLTVEQIDHISTNDALSAIKRISYTIMEKENEY